VRTNCAKAVNLIFFAAIFSHYAFEMRENHLDGYPRYCGWLDAAAMLFMAGLALALSSSVGLAGRGRNDGRSRRPW